jgi:tetratricopeptide (TPR) repeat protein
VRASRQDFEGALADFRRATQAAPDASFGYRGQGDMLRLLGRPDEAKVAYGQALEREPDDAEAHFGLALTLQGQDNLIEALGHLDRVVALAPESPLGWSARADVLVSLRAYDRAVDAIDHALRLAPTDADLWIQRGDTLRLWAENIDDPEQRSSALAAIEEALKHDAGNAVAMAISGVLKGSMGRFEDALADLSSSLDREPDYDWAIKEKGKLLLRAGKLGEALDVFGRLAGSAEERLDAVAGKAACLRRLGRSSECESELSVIDSGSRDDAKKFIEVARAFEDYEAYDDAIGMFSRAIERSPALSDAHNEIAWCQAVHLGQELEECTAHAQLAVSLSTDESAKGNYFDTLGWIWFKRGALNRAKRFLDQAVKLREPDLLIRKHVAIVEKAIADGAPPIVAA